eukprot:5620483-Prymnesium_polylepis.1
MADLAYVGRVGLDRVVDFGQHAAACHQRRVEARGVFGEHYGEKLAHALVCVTIVMPRPPVELWRNVWRVAVPR